LFKDAFKKLTDKIKGVKNTELVAIILVIAILAIMYPVIFTDEHNLTQGTDSQRNNDLTVPDTMTFDERQEERLERKLSVIDGAGVVEVLITYKAGRESVIAKHTVESSTDTEEVDGEGGVRNVLQQSKEVQPIIIDGTGGDQPMVLKELTPEVKGVIVIAEGARDVRVRMELLRAVRTALGVNSNQVEVFAMKQNNIKE